MLETTKQNIKEAAKDTVAIWTPRWWIGVGALAAGIIRGVPETASPEFLIHINTWLDNVSGGISANLFILAGIGILGLRPLLRFTKSKS